MDISNSLKELGLILRILGPGGDYLRLKIDLYSSDSIQDAQDFVGECVADFLTCPENREIIAGPICLKTQLVFSESQRNISPSFREIPADLFLDLVQTFGAPFQDPIPPTSDFIPKKHANISKLLSEKSLNKVGKNCRKA